MSRRQAKIAGAVASTRLSADVLMARRAAILKAWTAAQLKGQLSRGDLISTEKLRRECRAVMGALVEALGSSMEPEEAPAYQRLCQLLEELSRRWAVQGFSPAQTASFLSSLKNSIVRFLGRELAAQPTILNREVARLDRFLDRLRLVSFESFVAGREEVLRKQAQELEQRVRELEEERRKLRLLSRRLVRLQEEERRRLARELHDQVGQLLTAIRINLSFLQQPGGEVSQGSRSAWLQEAVAFTDQCLEQVRNLCYLLRPPLLEEAGLLSAVRWFLQRYAQHTRIEVATELPEALPRLPQEVEVALFRVVEEGMTNIACHAGSKVAHVRLTLADHCVTLVLADEGCGFSPQEILQAGAPGGGILDMQERVRELGGELRVESALGKGTKVILNLPLPVRVV